MKPFGFSRDDRLRSPLDFERIYALGRKAGDRHLLIFTAPNDLGRPRIGLSVSRKHGPAVDRNRLKRLLREAFRLSRRDLPTGHDFIAIPRQNSGATLADYRCSLKKLTHRLTADDGTQ